MNSTENPSGHDGFLAVLQTCPSHRLRSRPLASCLAAALATSSLLVSATPMPAGSVGAPQKPSAPTTWTVMNCDDSGTGSLRDIIENPMNAQSGDIVDLSQLPTTCGITRQYRSR